MKIISDNKGILGLVALFIMVMFFYNLFIRQAIIAAPTESPVSSIGDELVKIQKELQATTLDRELFSSSEYLLLTDFSVSIPQQPTGRPNPFDIIGRD